MLKRATYLLAVGTAATVAASVPALLPASAGAAPAVKLGFKLTPEKLGKSTTVSIGFEIPHAPGEMPSPLTEFDVLLPAEMGLGSSTLGTDTCSTDVLTGQGPSACPTDSLMGLGSAVAEASLGIQVVNEVAPITAFMTQPTDGHTTLVYYFGGKVPVIAPLVFPSEFLAAGNSPRSEFQLSLPAIPGLPETPDAAIVGMNVHIGPQGVTYSKQVDGSLKHYKPKGMAVPTTCPQGGFPFSAFFKFQDGSHVNVERKVPCPPAAKARHSHRKRHHA